MQKNITIDGCTTKLILMLQLSLFCFLLMHYPTGSASQWVGERWILTSLSRGSFDKIWAQFLLGGATSI